MRPLRVLVVALLLLGLAASFAHADDAEEQGPGGEEGDEGEVEEEEEVKKEKTEEIEEETDVMVLHINNFNRALQENKHLLVEFYAPWCGHCKRLEPIWAEAAGKLKEGKLPGAALAKVDVIEEKELGEEFEIQSFPTIKFFSDGERSNPASYTGKRTTEGILQWLERRMGPSATTISTTEGAKEFINANNVSVVGFFKSLEADAVKVFHEVAMDVIDMNFAVVSSPKVFKHFGLEADTVVLFKNFDDKRADLPVPEKLEKDDVVTFISNNAMPLVIPFSEENAEKIFGSKVHNHLLLFINSTVPAQKALLEEYTATASTFKGKVLFILIDTNGASVSHVLNYFGISASDAPTVRLIETDTVKKYAPPHGGAINKQTLQELCQGVLDGTLKPHMMSQEVPEDWDQKPVKVLVGKNFESVAFDETKNVFVEFYAPWCGHCKELTPIWEKLAEKYQDRDDIIIANMDSTANEVEAVKVSGFPTLKYFPAGADKKIVDYTGKRDLETLSKFLDNGGVLPEEPAEDDDDDDVDEDDDDDDDEEVTEETDKTTNSTKDEL